MIFSALVIPWSVDWDGDGSNNIVANSIIGTMIWYKNISKKEKPHR